LARYRSFLPSRTGKLNGDGLGMVESYANLIDRGFAPIQIAAGIVTLVPVTDESRKPIINNAGEPVMREVREVARYGLHALRHACDQRAAEGGETRLLGG
jgi:integrase